MNPTAYPLGKLSLKIMYGSVKSKGKLLYAFILKPPSNTLYYKLNKSFKTMPFNIDYETIRELL